MTYFTMTSTELRDAVASGEPGAQAEIDRRAAKRAAKRTAYTMVDAHHGDHVDVTEYIDIEDLTTLSDFCAKHGMDVKGVIRVAIAAEMDRIEEEGK